LLAGRGALSVIGIALSIVLAGRGLSLMEILEDSPEDSASGVADTIAEEDGC
jgi:hypothetical protein